jgi:hypothetical protein
MSLSLKGYVLEPPRVGGSNAATTLTPNDGIADGTAFHAAYPVGSEPAPRTEYLVLVMAEGNLDGPARLGWTKNEVVARFDYLGQDQRFAPLPGLPPEVPGVVGPSLNTSRLKVTAPQGVLSAAPFRLSVGPGSGTTLTVALVSAFASPPAGTVQLLTGTGELHWNPADMVTYAGQVVRFQRQGFATYQESTGQIGVIEDALLLCPLPASGQTPLVRLGYGGWMQAVEKASDGGFDAPSAIPSGTVQWSRTTGRLRFGSADLGARPGVLVFHDGTLFATNLPLPSQSLGTVASPLVVPSLPAEGGDLLFRLASGYRFPVVRRLGAGASFDAGVSGEVQVKPDGHVHFSDVDTARLGAQGVTFVSGDLPIERGVVLRLFRNPVNQDGGDPTAKDLAALYPVTGATWADPMVASPQVYLPALPRDDQPLVVRVEQGTGRFVGTLPRQDLPSPPAGLGYTLDFAARQMVFSQRKEDVLVSASQPQGALALPDPLVLSSNIALAEETGPGTGAYTAITLGQGALLDPTSGLLSFTTAAGAVVGTGTATLAGTTLTDSLASFLTTAQVGDYVVVTSGPGGVYRVAQVVGNTALTLDVPSFAGQGAYDLRRGVEVVADRAWSPAILLDPALVLQRTTPIGFAAAEEAVHSYGALSFPDALTAVVAGDFGADGVLPGDTLRLTSGPGVGTSRVVVQVDGARLTVDRAWTSFGAASGDVVRRLGLFPGQAVQLGQGVITPVAVATDLDFSVLPAGHVEVSLETGNLNFSAADYGQAVARVRTLTRFRDFQVTAALGFVELNDRLLAGEEVQITYRTVGPTGLPSAPITERAGFLVAKERTPTPRPAVTNQVSFNPTGRTVAASPAPAVYRGGRPQTADQVAVDLAQSTITFLPAQGFQTDALPSGSAVQTDERLYVDYYVHEAFGGERSFTVLQPPLFTAAVTLTDGASGFAVAGDQTSLFPAGYLLRVEKEAVYLLAGSTYDGALDVTTVTLAGGEVFAEDASLPALDVTTGILRVVTTGLAESYFVPEPSAWSPIPRGARSFRLNGDRTGAYPTGSVVYLAAVAGVPQDFYAVTGSSYDAGTGVTQVTLAQPLVREARPGQTFLRVSRRPIAEEGQTSFQTRRQPVVSEGYVAFRRTEGQPGVVLTTDLSEAGTLKADALGPGEMIGLFYVGYRLLAAGVRVKASYTATIAPSADNGLLGQKLRADTTVASPDTFFFRVETLTNFRGEVTDEIQAAALAQAPTAGPVTSHAASPRLYQQGSPSLFYDEGHIANVDYVARALLSFFHDAIDHLEDAWQSLDGRVVGATDGRFRFDGQVGNPVRLTNADITNDIDDLVQISPYPTTVVWNPPAPPVVTFLGTNVPLWQPSTLSRLYPTRRATLFGRTTAGSDTGASTGDPILDFAEEGISGPPPVVYRRWPRARVSATTPAGSTVLLLDNAQGQAVPLRPAFAAGMTVIVVAPDGTAIIGDGTPLTVASVLGSPERIGVSALPVPVPEGSTVVLCTTGSSADTSYAKSYRLGTDVGLDGDAGHLTYVAPYFPFDGSVPLIPAALNIQAPASGEQLQMDGAGITSTRTTPFRFPALDGGTTTDTGDTGLPLVGPVVEQEAQALAAEAALLAALGGAATPVVVSSLTVDATGKNLTAAPFWPSLPEVYDLVRFVTGPNAGAGWRRLNAVVGPNLGSVDTAFPFPSTTGQAVVTTGGDVAVGTASFPSLTVLSDAGLSGLITAGMTVVMTSGLNAGKRRQVVSRLSSTQLLLDAPMGSLAGGTYRVQKMTGTWSLLPTAEAAQQVRVLTTNDHHLSAVVDSQALAIDRFLHGDTLDGQDGVCTLLASGNGAAYGLTLTDGGQDFVAAGVTTAAYVEVAAGPSRGVYKVATVTSTVLTLATPFPSAGAVAYRVETAFGVSAATLAALVAAEGQATDEAALVSAWIGQMATVPVSVTPPDAAIFATGLMAAQVSARQAEVTARQALLADPVAGPGAILGLALVSQDKLYAKRFSWIRARVDGEDGTLYKIGRAQARRVDAEAKLVAQLVQLASVKGAP